MSQLKQFQSLFAEAMLKTDADNKHLSQLCAFIDTTKLSVIGQIKIYRGAVNGSLGYALESIYPVCRKLVGDEFFYAMTQQFIRQTPSQSPDLNDYGKNLAGFIETAIPLDDIPYLPDVARLEWLWHRTFHAATSETISAEELTTRLSQSPTSLLQPIEALRLLHSEYPVHRIWEMNQEEDAGTNMIHLDTERSYLVLWRDRWKMRIDEVDPDVLNLLETLMTRKPRLGNVDALIPTNESATALGYCLYKKWLRCEPFD